MPRAGEVLARRGGVAQRGAPESREAQVCTWILWQMQLWRGTQSFGVHVTLQYNSTYLPDGFLHHGVVWGNARNCCFTGTQANTSSLWNACAPTLTLSSCSVMYSSGSLLWKKRYYFGKKDFIILGKKNTPPPKKKTKTHKKHQNKTKNHCFGGGVGKVPFYNCQEGQNFQSLILQSILKISP